MDNQDRAHANYPHYAEDRRRNVLPSISSRHHYEPDIINDQRRTRQSALDSPDYAHSDAIVHTAYDPVHDAYDLPRISSANVGQTSGAYVTQTYPRAERIAAYNYSVSGRFDNLEATTPALPPMRDYQHEHRFHGPGHELEAPSYRSSTHVHSPGQSLHPFRVQAMPHTVPTSPSPTQTTAHGVRADDTSAPYTTLPPLSIPAAGPSSAEGKSAQKRIVMACHQCRGRKIRCDASRPACANCVRRHEECNYDAKPKRRGPDKVPGSRMRSCKSRKQAMDDESPSSPSGTFHTESSTAFFSSSPHLPSPGA
ncbi:hypothetical protein DFH11DRAFT_208816 [Phellopilus nigrolimitatus]|nr:hypothetical protein DFH11DRAFT_208816 [Phellopilus nigrolimitatus]